MTANSQTVTSLTTQEESSSSSSHPNPYDSGHIPISRERSATAVTVQYDSLLWKKSTASGSGNCVEVALAESTIFVRDSKDPRLTLAFSAAEWKAFLSSVDSIQVM